MKHRIGVAIIGTGFMSWVHAEALRRIGVDVVGVLGSTPRKSVAMAEQLGASRAYRDYAEVLSDDEAQSLHIGTPNRLHFEMARRGLEAGKHVMCEKPLAMTAEESAELVRIASQHKKQAAGVNYNIRYYPLCMEARQRVQSGKIGRVFHASGSYTQDWLLLPTDYNWRVLTEEGGASRAVSDIGTHWLDLIHWITGLEVEAVCADLLTVHTVRQRPLGEVHTFQGSEADPSTAVTQPVNVANDDYGGIMLRFRGGARGSLHVSQVTAGRKNCVRFEIAGSQQTLAWNSESPNDLWVGHRDRANELLIRDPALLGESARGASDYPGGHNEGYPDSFKQCFRAFYESIDEGEFGMPASYPTFADGHREIVLCDAILRSHQRQTWVEVEGESI